MKYKFYKLPDGTQVDAVTRTTPEGVISTIPFDPANIDYQEYLEWLKIDGNEPEAAD